MAETDAAEKSANQRPLDDLMLAMDVVDTLRHRAALVERELSGEDRDHQLIERLREIYATQGIDVPDHVLKEGVSALHEDRFTYTPPEPGLSVSLARIYVTRHRWLPPVLVLLGLAVAAWLAYTLLVTMPHQRLLSEIPRQVAAQEQAILGQSKVGAATTRAQELAVKGQQSLREHNTAAAQQAVEELKQLRSRLEQQYDLRIVSQGSTGVWRVPDVNSAARNYYIIVEAVTPAGQTLTVPITNEEDGKTYSVHKWGLRVDAETFHQVAADKNDDGVIRSNRFGTKKSGYLDPEYLMPTTGGAITQW